MNKEENKERVIKLYKSIQYEIDPKMGLVYKDDSFISHQRMMGFTLLKRISSNLVKGKSVMGTSFPITISDTLSLLDFAVLPFCYAPEFIQPLVQIIDPLERMKRIMSFLVACLHIGISQKKPFNSMLGETLNAKIDSLDVYAEQTSLKDSRFLIVGNEFRIHGIRQLNAHTYANSVRVEAFGKPTIEINGQSPAKYVYTYQEINVEGTVIGSRIFKYSGKINLKDKTNKLYGQIRFNPYKLGFFGSIFHSQEYREDHVKGFITRNKALLKDNSLSVFESTEIIDIMEGFWIENFQSNGKTYWDINHTDPPPCIKKQDDILPSDTRNRPDINLLREGKIEDAEKIRDCLEEKEEKERNLRKK